MEQDGIQEQQAEAFTATSKELAGGFSADHFLEHVAKETLEPWLLVCLPLLQKALHKTRDYDLFFLIHELRKGTASLLIETFKGKPQGVAVASVTELVDGRALHIMAIAGFPNKALRYPNAESFALLSQQAQAWGCTCIQGFAIESVARLWQRVGFAEISKLMRKEL